MEVAKLLISSSEMIQLDPNAIGQLRDVPKEVQKERREAALRAEMEAKMKQREKNESKTKMKGKKQSEQTLPKEANQRHRRQNDGQIRSEESEGGRVQETRQRTRSGEPAFEPERLRTRRGNRTTRRTRCVGFISSKSFRCTSKSNNSKL